MHKSKNENLKEPLASDKNGIPTKKPQEAVCLMPAGAYKGYGLSSMVDILCGVFTGMAFGRNIPAMYESSIDLPRHLGQFFLVIRADGCIEKNNFLMAMQQMTDEVRKEPSQNGEKVMLAGDPQIKEAAIRMECGIPIDQKTLNELKKLSEKYEVPLKLI